MASIAAWHGKTLGEHTTLRDDAAKQGYRFQSLSIYGSTDAPVYAAVMIKNPKLVAQRDWPLLTANEFQQVFDDQAHEGYGPVVIAATGSSSNPRFAAVFQPQDPIPLTRHRLKSGTDDKLDTIQGMNLNAKIDGLILRWAASYGDVSDPRFAAIWAPNPAKVSWNADGVKEEAADYSARFNAQTSGWCRPSFLTLQQDGRYLSVFVDNQIGPWIAGHDLTPSEYQAQLDELRGRGFFPLCVQAAGKSAGGAHFATLFAKNEEVRARAWHINGPETNAEIDKLVEEIMKATPLRQASLAIVHGKRLVYARGYTWAEPDWPITQPTTRFRIASLTKTMTALANYQLIEEGKLKPEDTVQDILQLKTPAGEGPKDARFKDMTIRHLLEHTSGTQEMVKQYEVFVLKAHKAARPDVSWSLPVTVAMKDAYIASLQLAARDPGQRRNYDDQSYYLRGRVVAKKRAARTFIAALQRALFDPLGITRVGLARSLLKDQPADEARYRMSAVGDKPGYPDIAVAESVMTDERPLVPVGYGNTQYELWEGSGGLSAATADVARIVAMLIDQEDNAALRRSTIATMLSNAEAEEKKFGAGGHGLNSAKSLGRDRFYGFKGGASKTSVSLLQFNGDWGFAVCWAGALVAPYEGLDWYPDLRAVMDIARASDWGSIDLFPAFGMPAL